ncbi:MAG: sulfatase-like hydrolase/transferase, partial [Planctomycetota bacterium]
AHQHANSAQWFTDNGGPVYSPPGFGLDHELDTTRNVLRQAADDQTPRFIYLNLSPPHMPLMDAPERFLGMYRRDDVRPRDNLQPIGDEQATREKLLTYLWDYRYYRDRLPYASALPEGCDILELHRLYMGLTSWVDEALGRVLDTIDETGIADRTHVVFTSDHGENLGSHGMMGKLSPNEEAYRIPMVWRGPGIAAGNVSDRVGSLVDLAPTLVDLASLTVPRHMQGKSLTSAFDATKTHREDADNVAFFETLNHGVGVRSATHAVNLPWTQTPDPRRGVASEPNWAFDLRDDPHQQNAPIPEDPTCQALTKAARHWDNQTKWLDG